MSHFEAIQLVGQLAPDFPFGSAATASGERLAAWRGHAEVVLFFYPRDATPGCTTEACAFRDGYGEFRALGAEVVGISGDSDASHAVFAERYALPFRLIADPDGAIRRLYGVRPTWGFIPGRVSVLIDRVGVVRHVHESQFRPRSHIAAMLGALRAVQAERG